MSDAGEDDQTTTTDAYAEAKIAVLEANTKLNISLTSYPEVSDDEKIKVIQETKLAIYSLVHLTISDQRKVHLFWAMRVLDDIVSNWCSTNSASIDGAELRGKLFKLVFNFTTAGTGSIATGSNPQGQQRRNGRRGNRRAPAE